MPGGRAGSGGRSLGGCAGGGGAPRDCDGALEPAAALHATCPAQAVEARGAQSPRSPPRSPATLTPSGVAFHQRSLVGCKLSLPVMLRRSSRVVRHLHSGVERREVEGGRESGSMEVIREGREGGKGGAAFFVVTDANRFLQSKSRRHRSLKLSAGTLSSFCGYLSLFYGYV